MRDRTHARSKSKPNQIQITVLQQHGGHNLCLNLGWNFCFSLPLFLCGWLCVCACVAGIIINYNGFQTERTASECNFLNVGINQEAEGFTGKFLWLFKSTAVIEAIRVDRWAVIRQKVSAGDPPQYDLVYRRKLRQDYSLGSY